MAYTNQTLMDQVNTLRKQLEEEQVKLRQSRSQVEVEKVKIQNEMVQMTKNLEKLRRDKETLEVVNTDL